MTATCKLLPSEQTERQRSILMEFLTYVKHGFQMNEPCDCGSQVRHNNGGNYHKIVEFTMDGGKVWRRSQTTSEYDQWGAWEEVSFGQAIEEIAELAALGW